MHPNFIVAIPLIILIASLGQISKQYEQPKHFLGFIWIIFYHNLLIYLTFKEIIIELK
jgi:peptidyl-tRNA hydrolase